MNGLEKLLARLANKPSRWPSNEKIIIDNSALDYDPQFGGMNLDHRMELSENAYITWLPSGRVVFATEDHTITDEPSQYAAAIAEVELDHNEYRWPLTMEQQMELKLKYG